MSIIWDQASQISYILDLGVFIILSFKKYEEIIYLKKLHFFSFEMYQLHHQFLNYHVLQGQL